MGYDHGFGSADQMIRASRTIAAKTDDLVLAFGYTGTAPAKKRLDVKIHGSGSTKYVVLDASADQFILEQIALVTDSAFTFGALDTPAAVSGATGTAQTTGITATGGLGGNTTNASGTGGIGGGFSFTAGAGGTSSGATASTGGAGGAWALTTGAGGACSVASTTSVGGAGGAITSTTGAGGATSGAGTTSTGGASGNFTLATGTGGATSGAVSGVATGGASGNISFRTGTGGAVTATTGTNVGGASGNASFGSGVGGAASGATDTGGASGTLTLTSGVGGAGDTGGASGAVTVGSGTGGAGSGTGGASGITTIQTGAAGSGGSPTVGHIAFSPGAAEKWRITSAGGLTSVAGTPANITMDGAIIATGGIAMTDVLNALIDDATNGSGTVQHFIGNNTIDVTAPSDLSVKENIVPAKVDALALLGAVEMVQFDRKNGTAKAELGWTAQQFAKVLPQFVKRAKTPDGTDGHLYVERNNLVPYLVKGIQELFGRLTAAEAKLAAIAA